VSGRYLVTQYVVSGDTLFSMVSNGNGGLKVGTNKIGVDNFNIVVETGSLNEVRVSTSYWRNGLRSTFTKEVTVSQTNYQYHLSPIKEYTPSVYEANIERNRKIIYERTVGKGALVIPIMDSPTTPTQSTTQEVIIVARPQW
jgi:hypothetical protein